MMRLSGGIRVGSALEDSELHISRICWRVGGVGANAGYVGGVLLFRCTAAAAIATRARHTALPHSVASGVGAVAISVGAVTAVMAVASAWLLLHPLLLLFLLLLLLFFLS